MTILNNDYDVEYALEECPESVFYDKGNARSIPHASKMLKITQSLSFTIKNLKLLRKNGFLSRWSYLRILFNKKEEEKPYLSLLLIFATFTTSTVVYLLLSLITGVLALLLLFSIFAGLGILAFGLFFMHEWSKVLFKNKLPEQFKEKVSYISIPKNKKDLYELVKNIKELELNHSEKEALFNVAEKYPYEANEQINKLMKLKEKIPTISDNDKDTLSIFDDTEKMIEELFAIRDSDENKKVINQVESILKTATERKKLEKIGVSVEELAEVSEFLEKMKTKSTSDFQNSGVSEVIANINAADKEFVNEAAARKNTSKVRVSY